MDEIEDVGFLREEVKRLRMMLREREAGKGASSDGKPGLGASPTASGSKSRKKDEVDSKRDEATGKRESSDRKGALNVRSPLFPYPFFRGPF